MPKPKLRGVIHLIAAPAALLAGIWLIVSAEQLAARVGTAVFVLSAINLFGVSATYHMGDWGPKVKTALRRLDHSNIFVIIAGTYTPLAILLLDSSAAQVLLAAIWVTAALGVLISTVWPHAPRWVSVPLYLAMGWVSVFYVPAMLETGGAIVVSLIALGGLLYSAGAVVYGFKRPNISINWFGFHELFHAFTVAAFLSHFAAIAIAVNI
jgi:hemolysin III